MISRSEEDIMDTRTMVVLHKALQRINKSVKASSEELESYLDDPMIADYYNNIRIVEVELDGAIYALEASMDGLTYEGYH